MTVPNSQKYSHEGHSQTYTPHVSQTNSSGVKVVGGFALQERLGSGSFATVYKGVKVGDSSQPSETVAIKAITRNSEKITKKVLENLELEISILRTYRHANIVCLHQVHKTERHFYLVLEYCAGGDLQRLIRSRRKGRLTERLARRLMRDLTAGLKFLWAQELIHRDIKPQNLLLTGPLPLDEINDPSKSEAEEDARKAENYPTNKFHLKIADFGFARHLQTTSMADTLCGSPLYMAPEILQHKRYDAKADLWSAGTVLFEMIAGRPPFHGENHIDLLRNIQQKSVRLPPDVKLSKEGVKLLRLLLHRNPISRAGFSDYIDASDAFVALGCNGVATTDTVDVSTDVSMKYQNKTIPTNLGPISEVEESHTFGKVSTSTVSTHAIPTMEKQGQMRSQQLQNSQANMKPQHNSSNAVAGQRTDNSGQPAMVSPTLGPIMSKNPITSTKQSETTGQHGTDVKQQYQMDNRQYSPFTPLEPSPPGPNQVINPNGTPPPLTLEASSNPPSVAQNLAPQQCDQTQQNNYQRTTQQHLMHPYRRIDSSQHSDDSGFVMVEKNSAISPGASIRSEDKNTHSPIHLWKQSSSTRALQPSTHGSSNMPSNNSPTPRSHSPRYFANKISLSSRNLIPPGIPFIRKGMLSTSPGTGGALVGMMGTQPTGDFQNSNQAAGTGPLSTSPNSSVINYDLLAKMLAAAEDVGRRAVNVAHVGDTRVYLAMKQILSNDSELSLLSSTPMEGVEENSSQAGECGSFGYSDDASLALYPARARAVSSDRSMSKQMKQNAEESEDEDDEMPFAVSQASDVDQAMTPIMSKPNNPTNSTSTTNMTKDSPPPIRTYFHEALSCYVKALSMLKGSINASQRVAKELRQQTSSSPNQHAYIKQFESRCEISHSWIAGQFKGVLERADAANNEMSKIQTNQLSSDGQNVDKKEAPITGADELIYNHSLTCGRDGAVKQLLGQNDAARSCYRAAGLLAETLLMEEKLGEEDRKTLEEYVQGFSERITELDAAKQTRQSFTNSGTTLIGPLGKVRNNGRM